MSTSSASLFLSIALITIHLVSMHVLQFRSAITLFPIFSTFLKSYYAFTGISNGFIRLAAIISYIKSYLHLVFLFLTIISNYL